VVHVIDLLQQSLRHEPLDLRVLLRQPLVFPRRCRCFPRWSSSAMPGPTLPSWSMSLVPLRGW
jgi:hypothetical protein